MLSVQTPLKTAVLTQRYLLEIDRQIRAAVRIGHRGDHGVINQVKGWHSINKQPIPDDRLILARMVRILNAQTLQLLFMKSETKISYQEFLKWQRLSIADIVFEGRI